MNLLNDLRTPVGCEARFEKHWYNDGLGICICNDLFVLWFKLIWFPIHYVDTALLLKLIFMLSLYNLFHDSWEFTISFVFYFMCMSVLTACM